MKSPADSYVLSRKLVMPDQINSMGSLFGGTLMSWMDKVGAMVAQRHASLPVVTASIDHIAFLAPVRPGHHVVLEGFITFVGKSSMEISVGAWAEDPIRNERVQTTQAFLTFVALDAHGKPARVPRLELQNPTQKRLHQEAAERARQRSADRRRFQERIGQHPELKEVLGKSF